MVFHGLGVIRSEWGWAFHASILPPPESKLNSLFLGDQSDIQSGLTQIQMIGGAAGKWNCEKPILGMQKHLSSKTMMRQNACLDKLFDDWMFFLSDSLDTTLVKNGREHFRQIIWRNKTWNHYYRWNIKHRYFGDYQHPGSVIQSHPSEMACFILPERPGRKIPH